MSGGPLWRELDDLQAWLRARALAGKTIGPRELVAIADAISAFLPAVRAIEQLPLKVIEGGRR